MARAIGSFLVVALIFGAMCTGQSPAKISTGTVFLYVVDAYGDPVVPTKISLVNEAGVDVSPKAFDGTLHALPYGYYTLSLESSGFLTWKGMIRVAQDRMRITIGLELAAVEGYVDRCRIAGTLSGLGIQPTRRFWLRLLPLFSTEVFEADVMANGKFSEKIRCGKYILVVMSGEGAIRMVPVDVTMMTKPMSIEIGKGVPLIP